MLRPGAAQEREGACLAEERERTVKSGSRQKPAGVVVGELLPAAKRASMETVRREQRREESGSWRKP
jgi:hypothetical protein